MKSFFVAAALFSAVLTVQAQVPQQKPDPLPAKEFVFPKYTEMFLDNGLKVFVIEDHEQPTVDFRLQIRGGEISEKKPGTASMLADLLTKGAGKRDALKIAQELDGVGAGVGASSSGDLTTVSGESLKKHLPLMMEIFADIIQRPSLPQDEFDKLKTQKLSEVKLEKARAGSILQALCRKVSYGQNHPSARVKTEAGYKSIELQDVKEFYSTYFRPNNATMAVIGDVNPKEIKAMLNKALNEWKSGDIPRMQTPAPQPMPQGVYFVARPGSVQSSTALTSPAVPYAHPDYEALRLAGNMMGAGFAGRLFRTLRETYSYTYTPFALVSSARDANRFTCGADVRNAVTDSTITVMQRELKKLREEPSSQDEIGLIKRFTVGQHLMNFENSEYLANLLLFADYNNQPISRVKEYPARFSALTSEQVMKAAKTYLSAPSVVVVGSPDVLEKLRSFGPVYEYTLDLEPKKDDLEKISLTVDQLMDNHRRALGGAEKIKAVQTLLTKASAKFEMNGQTLEGSMERRQKAPGFDAMTMDLKMFKSQTWSDGQKMWMSNNGSPAAEAPEAEVKKRMAAAHILYTASLPELGYKLEVKGKQGSSVIVKATNPAGEEETYYFDAKTWLITRVDGVESSPRGSTEISRKISGYKEFSGVQMPTSIITERGPVTITVYDINYTVNTPIEDTVFKP